MTARHQPLPNLSDIDLRLLRVFFAVVLSRGFAAAQRDLGISASNISVHISQLEQRLGVRLCERGRKGFRLTDEGQLIYDAALNLFRATDNFRGIVDSACRMVDRRAAPKALAGGGRPAWATRRTCWSRSARGEGALLLAELELRRAVGRRFDTQ